MKFAIKVAVSSNGKRYMLIGVIDDKNSFKSLGFVRDFDVAYLLNLTAREVLDLDVGIYEIS